MTATGSMRSIPLRGWVLHEQKLLEAEFRHRLQIALDLRKDWPQVPISRNEEDGVIKGITAQTAKAQQKWAVEQVLSVIDLAGIPAFKRPNPDRLPATIPQRIVARMGGRRVAMPGQPPLNTILAASISASTDADPDAPIVCKLL